jgi:hypothetical protein
MRVFHRFALMACSFGAISVGKNRGGLKSCELRVASCELKKGKGRWLRSSNFEVRSAKWRIWGRRSSHKNLSPYHLFTLSHYYIITLFRAARRAHATIHPARDPTFQPVCQAVVLTRAWSSARPLAVGGEYRYTAWFRTKMAIELDGCDPRRGRAGY